jgi:hypothetical protein
MNGSAIGYDIDNRMAMNIMIRTEALQENVEVLNEIGCPLHESECVFERIHHLSNITFCERKIYVKNTFQFQISCFFINVINSKLCVRVLL